MEKVHREIYSLLRKEKSQRMQRGPQDKSRKFKAGDMVLVDRRNLTIKDGTRKLSDKFIGPFEVTAAIGSYAYRVKLPQRMRMHNVIHVSLLKPYKGERTEGWRLQDAPETAVEQYQAQAILDSKKQRGGVVYRIRWVGYEEEEDTWESWESLQGAKDTEELVTQFHRRLPSKPRDGRVPL